MKKKLAFNAHRKVAFLIVGDKSQTIGGYFLKIRYPYSRSPISALNSSTYVTSLVMELSWSTDTL